MELNKNNSILLLPFIFFSLSFILSCAVDDQSNFLTAEKRAEICLKNAVDADEMASCVPEPRLPDEVPVHKTKEKKVAQWGEGLEKYNPVPEEDLEQAYNNLYVKKFTLGRGGDYDPNQDSSSNGSSQKSSSKNSKALQDDIYDCTISTYEGSTNEDDYIPLGQAEGLVNVNSMWPGALVQGNSIADGSLLPIMVDKAPSTITISNLFLDAGNSYYRILDEPSYDAVGDAIIDFLNSGVSTTEAKMSYYMKRVYNYYHFKFELNGSITVSIPILPISASGSIDFGTEWERKRNNIMVKFTQTYFTLSLDTPTSPGALFAPTVRPHHLRPYIQGDNPPAYISSVTYGRSVILLFSSKEDYFGLYGKVRVSFKVLFATISKTWEWSEGDSIIDADVMVISVDGRAKELFDGFAAQEGDTTEVMQDRFIETLKTYLEGAANPTPGDYGVPISYQARWLRNNEPAQIAIPVEYKESDCIKRVE
jgi:thiol-activated cytolysin